MLCSRPSLPPSEQAFARPSRRQFIVARKHCSVVRGAYKTGTHSALLARARALARALEVLIGGVATRHNAVEGWVTSAVSNTDFQR